MKGKHPNGLEEALKSAGISVAELARQADTSRQQADRYVKGVYELNREWAERFAPILRTTPEALIFGQDQQPSNVVPLRAEFRAPPDTFVAKDMPVFAAAEGGRGEMVITTEAIDYTFRPEFLLHVKDAYAVLITGTSMEPRYEAGEKVYVHPKAPLMRDKDVILCSDPHGGDFRASIKRLVRWTESQWYVRQYNPAKEFWLPKSEWRKAYRVFGRMDF